MDILSTASSAGKWSQPKKIIVYSTLGTVLILAIVAAFVPDAREYVTGMVKILLGGISGQF